MSLIQTFWPEVEALNRFLRCLVSWVYFQGLSFLFLVQNKTKQKHTKSKQTNLYIQVVFKEKESGHFRGRGRASYSCTRQSMT